MGRRLRRIFPVLAITAAVAWPGVAHAGTTGVVSGHVYGEHGQPLSDATVWVVTLWDREELYSKVSVKTHESFSRKTDSQGFFEFLSLNPGYYLIEPSMSGRAPFCAPRIVVDADQTTYVNLSMFTHLMPLGCPPPSYIYPITERLPLQEHYR